MQNSTFIGLNSVFSTFVNNHVVHLECGFCLSYESVWIISTVFSPLSSIVIDEKYYINSLIIFNIDLFDKCHVKPRELYRFFNSHNLGFCPFVYSQSIKKKKVVKIIGLNSFKTTMSRSAAALFVCSPDSCLQANGLTHNPGHWGQELYLESDAYVRIW